MTLGGMTSGGMNTVDVRALIASHGVFVAAD